MKASLANPIASDGDLGSARHVGPSKPTWGLIDLCLSLFAAAFLMALHIDTHGTRGQP